MPLKNLFYRNSADESIMIFHYLISSNRIPIISKFLTKPNCGYLRTSKGKISAVELILMACILRFHRRVGKQRSRGWWKYHRLCAVYFDQRPEITTPNDSKVLSGDGIFFRYNRADCSVYVHGVKLLY